MRQAIQSRRVVTPEGVRPACVVFENGVIVEIAEHEKGSRGKDLTDVGELFVMPGLVDTHVHLNEPGRAGWEGFQTGTRAAAAGGITCVVDMPLNSIPATTSVASLEAKRASARRQSSVDYAFWGGAVHGNSGQLEELARAGVRGFKCFLVPSGVDEFEMLDERDLRAALPIIAATGLPLLVHAELPGPLLEANGQHWTRYSEYLASRPDSAELQAIELMIRLCREFKCRIHIVHLASAEALPALQAAKTEGLGISVETCPHYLCFSSEEIPDKATQYKCAPPIRSLQTQNALWNGLKTGTIDMIATDHSPCPPQLKRLESGDFAQAWGGVASLSVAFSAVYTAAAQHGLSIEELAGWMSERPAELAGLSDRKGRLAPGLDADFAVFSPDVQFTVTEDVLHFRHPITPYLGSRLKGRVEQTWLRGQCVYRSGEFLSEPTGRECKV